MRLSSRALAGSGDSTWFMGKGIEFIGEVEEPWIPSLVFGSDTRSVGSADGGGTVGAVIVGCVGLFLIGCRIKIFFVIQRDVK